MKFEPPTHRMTYINTLSRVSTVPFIVGDLVNNLYAYLSFPELFPFPADCSPSKCMNGPDAMAST